VAWASGAGSSTGGAAFSASAAVGSSPSQLNLAVAAPTRRRLLDCSSRLVSTRKLVEDASAASTTSRIHLRLVDFTSNRRGLHRRSPRLHRLSSANQAKSLISIIFSSACILLTGTNIEDYFVYASRRLPSSRATPCQLCLGDVDRLPQAWCTKLGGSCHDVSCTERWRRTTATP
jgi:hypothetical protein